ncbi:copper amine oxidase N-terminal domain-containing protein [Paenibacillus cisolokensis]|uniref:stalk domain-containing protein n=1 Tax=Paenibacillus cisolokensis TaxID=1658519 RepID=UPI003D28CD13
MKSYIIAGITALLLIVIMSQLLQDRVQAQDEAAPIVIVDGEAVPSPGYPFYSGDILYVPARVMGTYYPYTFRWDNAEKSLQLDAPDGVVILKSGSREVTVHGEALFQLDAPVLLRQGHVYIPVDSLSSLTGAEVTYRSIEDVTITSGSVSISVREPKEPLATAEDSSYKLYAALKDRQNYRGFILEAGAARYSYDWQAPRLPSYEPVLHAEDVDRDGQPEVVVIFTTGTGTGLHMEEIHVVDPRDGQEIPVMSAEQAADEWIESRITLEGSELVIDVKLKGETPQAWSFRIPDVEPGDHYNSQVGVGGVIYYDVDGGKLTAEAAANIGFANYIGDFEFEYDRSERGFEPVAVTFHPFPEFEKYRIR